MATHTKLEFIMFGQHTTSPVSLDFCPHVTDEVVVWPLVLFMRRSSVSPYQSFVHDCHPR
jgi:hypothetical protein